MAKVSMVNRQIKRERLVQKFMKKREELKKISKENLEILRRIQNAEPTYDHLAWQDDARKHEVYMKNICELPLAIGPASISVQEMRRAALRG